MKHLSTLSFPVAIALALVANAAFAQDRPNTTLVQKSKSTAAPSKAGKTGVQSSAQPAAAAGRVDAKGVTPTTTRIAPATEAMPHDCHGSDA
jgi:hypothetical protein